jgi:hypothetical protein
MQEIPMKEVEGTTFTISKPHRQLRCEINLFQAGNELPNRAGLENNGRWKDRFRKILNLQKQFGGKQRIATALEKIVVYGNIWSFKELPPQEQ